jgi:hypothetical protein
MPRTLSRTSRALRGSALAAALVLLASDASRADVVVLTNGRRLQGTIVSEEEKILVLRVEQMGDMRIERSNVREIVKSKAPPPPAPEPEPAKPEPEKPAPATPAPDTQKRPPKQAPAATAKDASGADAVLARTGPWHVRKASLAEVVPDLARQAGLGFRVTDAGAATLRDSNPCANEYDYERTLASMLRYLLDFASAGSLAYRVEDGVLVVGLPHEVAGAAPSTRGSGLVWDDATGDVKDSFDPPGWRRPDLLELSVDSQRGYVHVLLRFAEELSVTLAQKTPTGTMKGYELVDLYLDVDDDPKTGKATSWDARRTGWEYEVSVSTGFELKDKRGNAFSQWGNIESIAGEHTIARTLATYSVRPMGDSGGMRINDPNDPDEPERLTKISGREVDVAIPYKALGIARGQRIRVCFLDSREELMAKDRFARAGTFVLQ